MLARVSDDELLERLIGKRIVGRSLLSLLELDLEGLHQAGLSVADINLMAKTNPAKVLGLERYSNLR